MDIAFAGTPPFAAAILSTLQQHVNIVAVYCPPDRARGRGRKITPCAVKSYAIEHGLSVFQPECLTAQFDRSDHVQADAMVVVAYGQILGKSVLGAPRDGCFNIHASLLPRWRGAAPIQRAILAGDCQTGVSIIKMDEGLDSGDIIAQKACPIAPDDTSQSLQHKLLTISCPLIVDTVLALPNHSATKQNEQNATYAAKLSKSEAHINWQDSAGQIERQVRAFNPYPIAQSYAVGVKFNEQVVKIISACALKQQHYDDVGQIIRQSKEGIDVATGDGVLRILTLQLAAKKPSLAGDFINAYRLTRFFSGCATG